MKNPTYGFLGTGDFAALCLSKIACKVQPEWVLTKTPKRAGRGMKLRKSSMQTKAEEFELTVINSDRVSSDTDTLSWIENNLPDLLLVVDFGSMIKEPLLSVAPLKCLNIHPSLLPQYRGSAPVQRAIMDGLDTTGVTVFRLDEGMDSGPILAQKKVRIEKDDDSEKLFERCASVGAELFLELMTETDTDDWQFKEQPETGVSFAPKIEKEETLVDLADDSKAIVNKIRALSPSPYAYAMSDGKRIKIVSAEHVQDRNGAPGEFIAKDKGMPIVACGSGAVKLLEVQPEGKKVQRADSWLNGKRSAVGDKIF